MGKKNLKHIYIYIYIFFIIFFFVQIGNCCQVPKRSPNNSRIFTHNLIVVVLSYFFVKCFARYLFNLIKIAFLLCDSARCSCVV